METLFCPTCKMDKQYYTEFKNGQNVARCMDCNTYIKNIPYNKPSLYVGKYKGTPIDEIDDAQYLQWALKTLKVNKRIKDSLEARINQLNFLGK